MEIEEAKEAKEAKDRTLPIPLCLGDFSFPLLPALPSPPPLPVIPLLGDRKR
jgi:hypothetical protein